MCLTVRPKRHILAPLASAGIARAQAILTRGCGTGEVAVCPGTRGRMNWLRREDGDAAV